jgi:hypothetical protein
MKKDTDRIKRWRERQKAEGKTSFTILLSQEARVILTEEKEKTGESYALIVEKALQILKKQGYRPPVLKHFSKREEVPAMVVTSADQPPVIPVTSNESGGQPRILIDDLANYSSEGIKHGQAEKEQNGIYGLKSTEGFIARLLHASAIPFGRRKKLFKLGWHEGKAVKVRDG